MHMRFKCRQVNVPVKCGCRMRVAPIRIPVNKKEMRNIHIELQSNTYYMSAVCGITTHSKI